MSVAALLGALRIDAVMHTAQIEGGVRKANSSLDSMSRKLIGVQNVLLGVAGAAGFGSLIAGMIDVTNKAQAWEAGMLSVTGSMGAAKKELAFVREESRRLGVSLISSTDQFVKLSASAQGTALEGAGVRDIFSATMEAARVFNLSLGDTEGAMRALAQMVSKGTVSMEEMRQQFAERIPSAMQAAARAMGMTVEQFSKAVSQGKILAEDLLPGLADEMRKLTREGLEMAESNPAAEFTRLSNAVVELGQAIGKSGVVGFLADVAKHSAQVVDGLSAMTKDLSDFLNVAEEAEKSEIFPITGGPVRGTGSFTPLKEIGDALKETEEAWKGVSEESEQQIDAMIKDIMRGTAPIKEELLPALARTKAAIAAVPVSETITVNVRDLGNVANIEGAAMERAALATQAHSDAMQELGQSARGAGGILSSLQNILGGFGVSLGGGAGIGIGGSISQIFGALSNPALLVPALSGVGASLAGGNTGAVAGAGLGALGGFSGGSAIISALLAGGPPTAALASIIPFIGPLLGIAGAGAGFFGGGFLQDIIDKDSDPRVSFGFYPSGTFPGSSGAFGQSSVLGNTPFGQISIGGRDGQGRTSQMFDIVEGIQNLDKIVASFLSPSEIRRAGARTAGIGELTGAGGFDPAQTIFLRFSLLFDALDNDLEDLWDTFKPTQQSLETFISSLEILTRLGDGAQAIAANFDMAEESFGELIAMLLTFQEFATTTFQDVDNLVMTLNESSTQSFRNATNALNSAVSAFDGTESSTRNLNAALMDFGRTELQVAEDLRRARASTNQSITSIATDIRHGGMSAGAIWEESRGGANRLLADISRGVYKDPLALQAASNQALQFFQTGWNALSAEQQSAQREDALQFLDALNTSSDTAFQNITSQLDSIHSSMANKIETAITNGANVLISSARGAAAAITNAASNLSNVTVNVNVNTSEING